MPDRAPPGASGQLEHLVAGDKMDGAEEAGGQDLDAGHVLGVEAFGGIGVALNGCIRQRVALEVGHVVGGAVGDLDADFIGAGFQETGHVDGEGGHQTALARWPLT